MNSMTLINQLKELHLSDNEAQIYVVLAELGQSPAGPMIKRTGLHRSVVYESLDKLIARKLVVQVTKNKKAHFQITDPARLVTTVERELDTARALVDHLRIASATHLPEIVVYEGVASYRKFWLDSVQNLPIGTTDYVCTSIIRRFKEHMGPDYQPFIETHIKRKIKWQMIVHDQNEIDPSLLEQWPNLHDYRLVNSRKDLAGNFNVWGEDRVILHSVTEPLIIEIKNPTFYQVFKNIFDILWDIGKPISSPRQNKKQSIRTAN